MVNYLNKPALLKYGKKLYMERNNNLKMEEENETKQKN